MSCQWGGIQMVQPARLALVLSFLPLGSARYTAGRYRATHSRLVCLGASIVASHCNLHYAMYFTLHLPIVTRLQGIWPTWPGERIRSTNFTRGQTPRPRSGPCESFVWQQAPRHPVFRCVIKIVRLNYLYICCVAGNFSRVPVHPVWCFSSRLVSWIIAILDQRGNSHDS